MRMSSSNPVLSDRMFYKTGHSSARSDQYMTMEGTMMKILICFAISMASATYTWMMASGSAMETMYSGQIVTWHIGAGVASLGLMFAIMFFKKYSAILAPLYALAAGVVFGGTSVFFESIYPGIVFQAVLGTMVTFVVVLAAYKAGLVSAHGKMARMVGLATAGIFVLYMVQFGLSMFTSIQIPHIFASGWIGIGFSCFVVFLAAYNLVFDFDLIDRATAKGDSPKYMEWYAAFALLITLVWLYLEILRLLAKLRD